uniref:Uncharacterized protein n=1 Tax=Romanomermis culicivorax TaxID=13658 RepID=A0A915I5G6_ROMCU
LNESGIEKLEQSEDQNAPNNHQPDEKQTNKGQQHTLCLCGRWITKPISHYHLKDCSKCQVVQNKSKLWVQPSMLFQTSN